MLNNDSVKRVLIAVNMCLTAMTASLSGAQEVAPAQAVVEAGRLRDEGKFADAIAVLRTHRALYPEDGDAARTLAQLLYWMKDIPGARALYDSSIVLRPDDQQLRIQYARMLMETGERARARDVLAPLTSGPSTNPSAVAMLGTIAYWDGDIASARRYFVDALAVDSSLVDARRQLDEIQSVSAPWIRLSGAGLHDDQVINRAGSALETGYYLTPLWAVKARGAFDHLSADDTASESPGSTTNTIVSGSLGIKGSMAAVHGVVEAELGAFRRSLPSKGDWIGAASLAFNSRSFATFRASVERAPYLYTTASVLTHVMTNTAGATLDIDSKGWIGKASYDLQSFPDDNTTSSAYAWAMAPIVRTTVTTIQAGYAASYQNADKLRFVSNTIPGRPTPTGHYEPYYTPQDIQIHSVIGSFTGSDNHGLAARVGGSYGFHATEEAPSFTIDLGVPILQMNRRTFHPWTVRASVEKTTSSRSSIIAHVDHSKTAFYTVTNLGLELTWRLAPR